MADQLICVTNNNIHHCAVDKCIRVIIFVRKRTIIDKDTVCIEGERREKIKNCMYAD